MEALFVMIRRAILDNFAPAAVALALAGCAPSLSAAKRAELTALACDADRLCQAHGNLSDENWPLMPVADGACVHLAQTWLRANGTTCGAAK